MWGLPQEFWSLESESEQSSKEVSNTQVSRTNTRKMDSADDDLLRSYKKTTSKSVHKQNQWVNDFKPQQISHQLINTENLNVGF